MSKKSILLDNILGLSVMPIVSILAIILIKCCPNAIETNIYYIVGWVIYLIAWFISLMAFFLVIMLSSEDNNNGIIK